MNQPAPVSPPGQQVVARDPRQAPAPLVSYLLIGFTIFVYILQMLSETLLGTDYPLILGVKDNSLILAGQLWRFITPLFLHGSLFHIALQMFWLYTVGKDLEVLFGKGRYLALYLLSGFAGIVFSFLLAPNAYPFGSGMGLFGLIGAQIAFVFINRQVYGERAWRMLRDIGVVVGINLLIIFLFGLDQIAVIGGLAGGLFFSWFAAPKWIVERVETEQQAVLILKDTRTFKDTLTAGALVLLVFGALAATRFLGLWPL